MSTGRATIESSSHEIVLKIAHAIRDADVACEIADGLSAAEILRRHLDQDVDVLCRHEPVAYENGAGGHYCFWCSEDGFEPIIITWPCPEVRSVAKALGVEL